MAVKNRFSGDMFWWRNKKNNYGKCSKISNTLKLRTPKIIAENNFQNILKNRTLAFFGKVNFLNYEHKLFSAENRCPFMLGLLIPYSDIWKVPFYLNG